MVSQLDHALLLSSSLAKHEKLHQEIKVNHHLRHRKKLFDTMVQLIRAHLLCTSHRIQMEVEYNSNGTGKV